MSRDLIKKYSISAKKSLGQNFLVDENIVFQISSLVDIRGSNIVEIGPGYGVLTEKLLKQKPQSLHLVELDIDMISILEQRISQWELQIGDIDFQIHNVDVLTYISDLDDYSVIANIPYYITSPILRHFLYELEDTPKQMIILMQKDVGDKILWKWKNKSSVLSLMIEKKCKVAEKILVPKESFIPKPKVESSVLLFEKYNDFWNVSDIDFLKIIKIGFSEPRKKLVKNLIKGWYQKEKILTFFEENALSENTRWEDLNVKIWCQLLEILS